MDRNQVTITVSGLVGSGKSHLTSLIKDLLIEKGFDVKHEGNVDFESEEDFDKNMRESMDQFIDATKQTKHITIKEQQLNRSLMEN